MITTKQLEVINYVRFGLTNKKIAEAMGVKDKTIKFHLTGVYRALGVSSRAELLSKLVDLGLSPTDKVGASGSVLYKVTQPVAVIPEEAGHAYS